MTMMLLDHHVKLPQMIAHAKWFLDSTKLKTVWIKITFFKHFPNNAFQSYYDLFQVN